MLEGNGAGQTGLGDIGKTDNGVVSVSSLWADEGVYYPLKVESYTPAHHFEGARTTRSSAPS
jgi:hypothetical protein